MSPMKRPSPARVEEMSETLSLESVAQRLKLTRKQVRQLLGDRQLDFVQIRGQFRVLRKSLDEYLSERGTRGSR